MWHIMLMLRGGARMATTITVALTARIMGVYEMFNAKVLVLAGLSLIWLCSGASARIFMDYSGYIWKTVAAAPGEDVWQACRRHYGYDAVLARRRSRGTVDCFVPGYYLYGPGQSRQNFN